MSVADITARIARRAIRHHEAAAARATTLEKRKQHETAAAQYRKDADIPEPVDFGRHESHDRAAILRREIQKRETEFKNR